MAATHPALPLQTADNARRQANAGRLHLPGRQTAATQQPPAGIKLF